MRPLKIVMVFDFKEGAGQPLFYNMAQQVGHGLGRLGHMVTRFSDRDAARLLGFGHKRFGVKAMKKRLRLMAETIRPDIILFGHPDLFNADDFADLRGAAPNVRLAQLNVDPPYRREVMKRFASRTPSMDASFFTAADFAESADLFDPKYPVLYVAPTVDPSVTTGRAFDLRAQDAPRDVAFLGSVCVDRPQQIERLRAGLPGSIRFETHGASVGKSKVIGATYLDYLAQTPMSPSLQPDSAASEPRLYASSRVTQLLGQGVLTFAHATTELDKLWGEGIRLYNSIDDLAEQITRFHKDDAERRKFAQTGWRLAFERVRSDIVADYIVKATMGDAPEPPWPGLGGVVS